MHPLKVKAAYHDACHLCHAQQIRSQPRQLLAMIPGLELLPSKGGVFGATYLNPRFVGILAILFDNVAIRRLTDSLNRP